jgi:hypothetical protein
MRVRALLLVALVTVLIMAGVGLTVWFLSPWSGDETGTAEARPQQFSVEDARHFDEYPVYWLGESFQGLPLTDVARMDWPGAFPGKPYNDPWHEVSFTYGDCDIAPGEESCAMPLSVGVRPYCEVPPEVIAEGAKTAPPEVIRGATVQRLASGTLQMWTGNVTVNIAATDQDNLMLAAQNLVRLNGDGKPSTPSENLGPPDEIDCPPMPGMKP